MIGRVTPENYARIMAEIEHSTAIHAALDLDDTAIPINEYPHEVRQQGYDAAERFGDAYKTIPARLGKLCFLDINTGRTHADYLEYEQNNDGLRRFAPYLDGTITSVGTAIHYRTAPDSFAHDTTWPNVPHWHRQDIADMFAKAVPLEGTTLEPQTDEAQGDYKLSYNVFGLPKGTSERFATYASALLAESSLQASIALSFDPYEDKHYFDISPEGINKGSGLIYSGRQHFSRALAKEGAAVPDDARVFDIAFDDTDNGRAALAAANLAIVPGNAQPSLVEWAEATIPHKLYRAEANFAEGAHEGLAYFNIVSPSQFAAWRS